MSDDSDLPDIGPEIRDIGPFRTLVQAMREFTNWSAGIPQQPHSYGPMLIAEAALGAGAKLSDFEIEYLQAHKVDPVLATIIQGAIIRAHRAGHQAAVNSDTSD